MLYYITTLLLRDFILRNLNEAFSLNAILNFALSSFQKNSLLQIRIVIADSLFFVFMVTRASGIHEKMVLWMLSLSLAVCTLVCYYDTLCVLDLRLRLFKNFNSIIVLT